MITQKEQIDRLKIKDCYICYVDSHGKRYADPFVEQVCKNITEYNVLDLEFLKQPTGVATNLHDALEQAKSSNCKYLLYVELGNIIDWCDGITKDIRNCIDVNPDIKFIGHILQAKNGSFYIHPQFFLVDVKWALENKISVIESEDENKKWLGPVLERSQENFHNNYTPVWTKATGVNKKFRGKFRGANIIKALADTNSKFMPWPEQVRNKKTFLYPTVAEECVKNKTVIAKSISTSGAYIANTEEINTEKYYNLSKKYNIKQIFTPASGLNTFLLGYYMQVPDVVAYDISLLGLSFVRIVRDKWDGTNYKEFIMDEIVNHNSLLPIYYGTETHLDNADLLVKNLGKDFVDWWKSNKSSLATAEVDIFDHHTWNRLKKKSLGDCPTLFNLSNILHYAPTASILSLQNRIDIFSQFRHYWYSSITTPENLILQGMNPIDASRLSSVTELNNYQSKRFPWNV